MHHLLMMFQSLFKFSLVCYLLNFVSGDSAELKSIRVHPVNLQFNLRPLFVPLALLVSSDLALPLSSLKDPLYFHLTCSL